MRITDTMRFNAMVNNLNNAQSDYSEISEQIASQKKVNRASDNPVAATRILDIQQGKAANEQYQQNMQTSSSWISATNTTLSSVYDMLKTATGIALGAAGSDTAAKQYAASNVQDIIDSMRNLANTKWGDRYLFSGTRQDTAPFTETPTAATIDPVQTAGSNTFTGTAVSSGTYTGNANKTYLLEITSAGVLGKATYRLSTDGGATWGADTPTPADGTISLGDGVTLTLTGAGSLGLNDSFSVSATVATTIQPAQASGGNLFAGTVASSGTYTGGANKTYELEITSAGVLGTATYRLSTDGGATWGANTSTPANGIINLGDGVTLTLTGGGSLGLNDRFSVNTTVTATIQPAQATGGNLFAGTVASSGIYTGDTNKTYALKITSAGVLGVATYKFSMDGGRTWNTNAPAPDLVTPANGIISLGDGVNLTLSGGGSLGLNDVFYVNATAAGYYQGNDENLSLTINRGTDDEYSLTGAQVFTAAGANGVDIFKTLYALKDALSSDAVANTSGGTPITAATLLKDIDGYTDYLNTDYIHLGGTDTDGNVVSDNSLTVTGTTTVGDLLGKIQAVFGDVTASIASDGKLNVVDNSSGASLLAVQIGVRNVGGTTDATLLFNEGQTSILDVQKVLSDQAANLQKAQNQVLLNQAECGTRKAHLEIVKNNVTAFDESLSSLLSDTQDANVTELAMKISLKEIALNSSYAIAAKLESTTILNFLQ